MKQKPFAKKPTQIKRKVLASRALPARFFVFLFFSINGFTHDWPQFLGPTRNGISVETNLLEKFPAKGPP
ncbi:MAG: hypothetical protein ACR2H1_07145, partial [Limisphaerales bacterium]